MLNSDESKECIPHRSPFLGLDSVTEITESSIVATKHLSADLPVFQGHYPQFPVFPGVLQCEACFQAGAVLISKVAEGVAGEVPVVTRQNNTQFRRLIRPGETIQVEVELTERVSNAFYLKGRVSVDGKVTARLDFVCSSAAVPV
ncbi:MAG: 3-hydroxyacyl-ACP dehydratase FabZ family protein [Fuerstiella sp.]